MTNNKSCFRDGDQALLIDRKGRRYMLTLSCEQVFHFHLGRVPHDQLIGQTVGGWYRSDRGHVVLAVRPTLADFVLEMPRGPQIIYPKDLGNIISLGDIFPGATVVEGGLGSGSLTAALLRAVGSSGRVITYEINESVLPKALANINKVVHDPPNLTVTIGDIYEGIAEEEVGPGGARRSGTVAGGVRCGRCPGHGWDHAELLTHHSPGASTSDGAQP